MLSCEFCEIYKSNFFTEHLQWLLMEKMENDDISVSIKIEEIKT